MASHRFNLIPHIIEGVYVYDFDGITLVGVWPPGGCYILDVHIVSCRFEIDKSTQTYIYSEQDSSVHADCLQKIYFL
jgi:hypothetical protein